MANRKSITYQRNKRNEMSFAGRDEQIQQFENNLLLPEDHSSRRYIINITGQGGVGKTWLGNRFIKNLREKNYITATVDRNLLDVIDAMQMFAEQLEEQGCWLKRFSQRYKVYRQKRDELASDPDAPGGILDIAGSGIVRSLFAVAKTTPANPFINLIDQDAFAAEAGKGLRYLYQKITNKDEQYLLLRPAEVLTPLFLQDLWDIAEEKQICLWIDTYEQNGKILDEWLRHVYAGDFGDLPLALLLIISGRDRLREIEWQDFWPLIMHFSLEPFREVEARKYLSSQGINDEGAVVVILRLSMRLPMLLHMLASQRSTSSSDIGDVTGTAVERFLQWIEDPVHRELALDAALPRFLNRDVVSVLLPDERAAPAVFEWLCNQPFVIKSGGVWIYHDLVRELMLKRRKEVTHKGWEETHARLARYYEGELDKLGLSDQAGRGDPAWQKYSLEVLYHRLCESYQSYIPVAIKGFVTGMLAPTDFDLRWAKTVQQAESDTDEEVQNPWGMMLIEGIEALYITKNYEKHIRMFDRLLEYPLLPKELHPRCFFLRGIGGYVFEQYEQVLADMSQAINLAPDHAEYYVIRAAIYHQVDQYEQAIADLSQAIKLSPPAVANYYFRGAMYYAIGRYEQAMGDFSRAIELEPENPEHYYARGACYHEAGQYEDAITDKSQAIELAPTVAKYWASRGKAYQKAGQYEQAISDLSQAMELEPDNAEYYHSRWESYHKTGQFEQALADATHAIALEPDSPEYYLSRGVSCLTTMQYDQAIADISRAIDLQPDNAEHYYTRSTIFLAKKEYNRAIEDASRAIELQPEKAESYYTRGLSYRASGRYEQAVSDTSRAIELQPDNSQYYFSRASSCFSIRQYEQAIADLNRAVDLQPDNASYYYTRSHIYLSTRQFEQAVEDLTRAIEIQPDNADYHYTRSQYYLSMKQYSQAIADLARSFELDPMKAEYYYARAIIYREMGKFAQAIEDLARAIELDPHVARYYLSRGINYAAIGQYEHALADSTSSIHLEPTNAELWSFRSTLNYATGQYEQAFADATRAIELEPGKAKYLHSRAKLYFATGHYQEAVADQDLAVRLEKGKQQ